MSNLPTYLESIRESVDTYEFMPENFRKVIDALDNALHYIDKMDRQLQTTAHATSCLLNGTRPD